MAMFPGRFPNEILHDLDAALLEQILSARQVEHIENKRSEWLKIGTELTTADWEAIRENDRLVEDYTVKVITQ